MTAGSQGRMRDSVEAVAGVIDKDEEREEERVIFRRDMHRCRREDHMSLAAAMRESMQELEAILRGKSFAAGGV